MNDAKIITLMEGYQAGTLTGEEAVAFFQWYSETGMEEFQRVWSQYQLQLGNAPVPAAMPDELRQQLEEAIREHEAQQEVSVVSIFRRYRFVWAAAVLVLIVVGTYLYIQDKQYIAPQVVKKNQPVNDALPGTTKAVLTLADGSRVIIDSVKQGQLAIQGSATVQRDQGVIAYNENSPGKNQQEKQSVLYNTLTTARGEQSPPLVLGDGTKVWLNAMSSIRFPVVFTGNTRTVEITGEAYFEIAKNAAMPFHVKVNEMDVEALGTQFNVNAYADEPSTQTTLLEGSVKVVKRETANAKENSVILKPGEQAEFAGANSQLTIDHSPNIDQVMAWKRGLFDFNHASLQTVLRQLARWYDIEVIFEGNISNRSFRGKITRDLNLSQVINILQDLDIKFRVEGKKLIVSP